jgi:hypothetical protein
MGIRADHASDDDRDRAVTASDYEASAFEASDAVAIAGALGPQLHDDRRPPYWMIGDPWLFAGIDRSRGNVSLIVVPEADESVDTPQPTTDLLRQVQAYVDARRVLTNRLAVIGPRYQPITVIVDVITKKTAVDCGRVKPGELAAQVLKAIQRYLHPIHGAHDCKGWQIGQSVDIAALGKAIAPDNDLGSIANLVVTAAIPQYHFPPLGPGGPYDPSLERPILSTTPGTVALADYELVCWDRAGAVVNDKGVV